MAPATSDDQPPHRAPRRQPHDETGAAALAILDPRLAALRGGVLGDEGEAEPGADAVAGGAAAGEALEDAGPLAAGDAGAGVLDGDEQERAVGRLDRDARRAAAVVLGVLEQVGEDALEAHPVEHRGRGAPFWPTRRRHVDRQAGEAGAGGDAPAQRVDLDLLGVQVGGAGVDARQLEEVDDHGVEPAHLADDDVEGLLGAVGQLAAAAVDDLGGGGQRGDRGAQLVADVGGEAGLALDAGLHGIGHVVERVGELVEVGIALARDPGVEVAGGDLTGGVGDPTQRSQQTPTRPPPDARRQRHRDQRADDQGQQDRPQRAPGGIERERLEVVGIDLGDVDADADVAVPPTEKRWMPDSPDVHGPAQLVGEALAGVPGVGARRSSPLRTAAANPPDSVRRPWNHSPKSVEPPRSWSQHPLGVADALAAGQLGALLEEGGAGEGVGHGGQRHGRDECDHPEQEADLGAQAHRATSEHASQCGRRSPLPVRHQGEEGTPPGQREQPSSSRSSVTGAAARCARFL